MMPLCLGELSCSLTHCYKELETTWKGKYQNKDSTKIGNERGNSYRKMKRSPDKRHTQNT